MLAPRYVAGGLFVLVAIQKVEARDAPVVNQARPYDPGSFRDLSSTTVARTDRAKLPCSEMAAHGHSHAANTSVNGYPSAFDWRQHFDGCFQRYAATRSALTLGQLGSPWHGYRAYRSYVGLHSNVPPKQESGGMFSWLFSQRSSASRTSSLYVDNKSSASCVPPRRVK